METIFPISLRQRLSLRRQGRNGSPSGSFARWFFLLTLLVTAVTGVKADGYVTDVMVFGVEKDGSTAVINYTAQGWNLLNRDLNESAGGDDIYIHMTFAEQTLSMNTHPTFSNNLIYTGEALNLLDHEPEGNYGTMKYSAVSTRGIAIDWNEASGIEEVEDGKLRMENGKWKMLSTTCRAAA